MDPFESVPGYFLHLQIRRRAEKKRQGNPPGDKNNCSQQIHLHFYTLRRMRRTDEGHSEAKQSGEHL